MFFYNRRLDTTYEKFDYSKEDNTWNIVVHVLTLDSFLTKEDIEEEFPKDNIEEYTPTNFKFYLQEKLHGKTIAVNIISHHTDDDYNLICEMNRKRK